ncbi:hypothetical protein [Syntrophomonas palmitatica]|uniref:hypothetical protein n=1 Tax=Syntrophomonas palmitatica TaxID=402877 RepID=UPI0006D0020C|nr:hypothetical protein [Syntrophomonas palmitatica]
MIYKLTLLKELPESPAGFSFLLRGGLASHDGEEWFSWIGREGIYGRMYQLFVDKRTDWIKIEESGISDNSYDLQDSFPNNLLLSFKEALDQQSFLYDENFNGINNIRCCNEQVKMLGASKADCIYCCTCGKAVQDAVNFLVWGLEDIPAPRRAYFMEFRYDPYKKYLAGQVKSEHLIKR